MRWGCAAAYAAKRTTTGTTPTRDPWDKASTTSSAATSRPMGPGRNWVPMSPSSNSPSVRPTSLRSTTLPAKRSWPTPSPCAPTSPNNKRCSKFSWTPNPKELSRSCTRTWDGSTNTKPTSARSPRTVSSRACHAKATASTTVPPSRSSVTSRTSSFAARTGRPSRASKPTSTPTSRTGTQQDAK